MIIILLSFFSRCCCCCCCFSIFEMRPSLNAVVRFHSLADDWRKLTFVWFGFFTFSSAACVCVCFWNFISPARLIWRTAKIENKANHVIVSVNHFQNCVDVEMLTTRNWNGWWVRDFSTQVTGVVPLILLDITTFHVSRPELANDFFLVNFEYSDGKA